MKHYFILFGLFIIGTLIFNQDFKIKDLLKCIFPISYSHYWFITNYIVIYIFSDYINKFLKNLLKKEYIVLILILIIMWSIMPTIMNTSIEFSNIDWFLVLYMIGAYIRLYNIKLNSKKVIITLIIFVFLSGLSIFILDNIYNIKQMNPLHFALPMNQILPFVISICLFLIFERLNIKNNKVINKIASCTLGVYLIHTHILIRDVIWIDIFKVDKLINKPYIVLYEFLIVAIVYITCILIDCIRKNTVEKIYVKLIDKIEKIYTRKYKNKLEKLIANISDRGN